MNHRTDTNMKKETVKSCDELRQEYLRLINGFAALNRNGAFDTVIENLMGELVNIEKLNEKRKNNLTTIKGGL